MNFVKVKMSMTHIYQPVMIRTMLKAVDGAATVGEIASGFLNHDDSQLEYYKAITKRWPHKTLIHHGVVRYQRGSKGHDGIYRLQLDKALDAKQRERLREVCTLRLEEFKDKDPWIKKFRMLDKRSMPGTLRYDIIAKAGGMCVACGIKSTEALLHVDHITPVSRGGKTVSHNLQALCYRCNTEKRDRDETDFVLEHNRLKFRKRGCPHCKKLGHKHEIDNSMAFVTEPSNPATKLQKLVVPHRHITGAFDDMFPSERQLCLGLVDSVKKCIKSEDNSVKGFDVFFDQTKDTELKHYYIIVMPKR